MQLKEFDWLSGHGIWAIIQSQKHMITDKILCPGDTGPRFVVQLSININGFLLVQMINNITARKRKNTFGWKTAGSLKKHYENPGWNQRQPIRELLHHSTVCTSSV